MKQVFLLYDILGKGKMFYSLALLSLHELSDRSQTTSNCLSFEFSVFLSLCLTKTRDIESSLIFNPLFIGEKKWIYAFLKQSWINNKFSELQVVLKLKNFKNLCKSLPNYSSCIYKTYYRKKVFCPHRKLIQNWHLIHRRAQQTKQTSLSSLQQQILKRALDSPNVQVKVNNSLSFSLKSSPFSEASPIECAVLTITNEANHFSPNFYNVL